MMIVIGPEVYIMKSNNPCICLSLNPIMKQMVDR